MPVRKIQRGQAAHWEWYEAKEIPWQQGTKKEWQDRKKACRDQLKEVDRHLAQTIEIANEHADQEKLRIQLEIDRCDEALGEIEKDEAGDPVR